LCIASVYRKQTEQRVDLARRREMQHRGQVAPDGNRDAASLFHAAKPSMSVTSSPKTRDAAEGRLL
jgi:hypothetical protein